MNKEALNVLAKAFAKELYQAKIYYEDRIENIFLTEEHIDVAEDTVSVHFVLDDENTGKVTKIKLFNKDGVEMKDRPFSYELLGEYNLYILFKWRVEEVEITKDMYLGGVVSDE